MMKTKLLIVVAVAAGIIGACGPKSRYRAVDVKGTPAAPVIPNRVDPNANSTRPGLGDDLQAPEAPAPADAASLKTLSDIEFAGVSRIPRSSGVYGVDLIIKRKTGTNTSETRFIELKSSQTAVELEKINLLQSDESVEEQSTDKASAEGACADHTCNKLGMTLTEDQSKIKLNAEIDSRDMLVTSAIENQVIADQTLKELINHTIKVQTNLVKVPNSTKEYYSLVLGIKPAGLVFSIKKSDLPQNLPIIFGGKKFGITSANFNGNHSSFTLTLRDKDARVVADLKFGPVPAPAASPAAPEACFKIKDSTNVLTLSCSKEFNAGVRVAETYSVKILSKITAENPAREFKHKLGDTGEDKSVTIAEGQLGTHVDTQKSAGGLIQFTINSVDNKSKAAILLSEECCPGQTDINPVEPD